MDAFANLASYASPDFASTTGFSIYQATGYATSSMMQMAIGAPLDFLYQNHVQLVAFTMIFLVLLLPLSAFAFYQHG